MSNEIKYVTAESVYPRFDQQDRVITALEMAVEMLFDAVPGGEEIRTRFISNLKQMAQLEQMQLPTGQESEFALLIRRMGGTYP